VAKNASEKGQQIVNINFYVKEQHMRGQEMAHYFTAKA
jgi:hypothetical protein